MTEPVFVVGVGMTQFAKQPKRTIVDLGHEAIEAALADACVPRAGVEIAYAGHARTGRLHDRENGVVQELLLASGMGGIPAAGVGNFCASGSTAFHEAVLAVASGFYDVALAVGVEQLSTRPERGRPLTSDSVAFLSQFGFTPPAFFAMVAQRYMSLYGVSAHTLAKVAVKNRRHGSLNPLAHFGVPVSVEEVLAAPMLAEPLTRLSCCPTSDGAAAAIVVSCRAATKLGLDRRVRVRGGALASADGVTRDLATSQVDARAAAAAYTRANIGPGDLDVVELHDAFTSSELIHYEDLGLCARGEGARLLLDGDTSLGGRVPVNPSGGLLSRGHPLGATGIAQIYELVLQLRHEAGQRQVDGARIGLAHCSGGFAGAEIASSAVHVLERLPRARPSRVTSG